MNLISKYFGPVDIQRLTIQILDEYGRVLDLNNMDWSFVLSFGYHDLFCYIFYISTTFYFYMFVMPFLIFGKIVSAFLSFL